MLPQLGILVVHHQPPLSGSDQEHLHSLEGVQGEVVGVSGTIPPSYHAESFWLWGISVGRGWRQLPRATACTLPSSTSLQTSHSYYERLHNAVYPYGESLQQIARVADWARATRIQSGLLWPEVGTTFVVWQIWKKRHKLQWQHCLIVSFSALSSPSTLAHLKTLCFLWHLLHLRWA